MLDGRSEQMSVLGRWEPYSLGGCFRTRPKCTKVYLVGSQKWHVTLDLTECANARFRDLEHTATARKLVAARSVGPRYPIYIFR